VGVFAAFWKALGSSASTSGFTMGCKWRWPGKTTEGTASGMSSRAMPVGTVECCE